MRLNELIERLSNTLPYLTEDVATTRQECLHAVGLAITQNTNKDLDAETLLDMSIFTRAWQDHLKVDGGMMDVYDFASKSKRWVDAVIRNINALRSSGYIKKKGFLVHRSDSLMNEIYDRAKTLLGVTKWKGTGQDKWNPGDIWLSSGVTMIPEFDDIQLYNEWIEDKLRKKTLIGVSLKQSAGSGAKVAFIDQKSRKPFLRYRRTKAPKHGPFGTGITITTQKGTSITIRSPYIWGDTKITTEVNISGSKARHGKAPISLLVKKYGGLVKLSKKNDFPTDIEELKKKVVDLWRDNGITFSDKVIENDWNSRMVNEFGQMIIARKPTKDDSSKTRILDEPHKYFKSIVHSLEIGRFLSSIDRLEAAKAITMMFRYGASLSDFSSDYLKVM